MYILYISIYVGIYMYKIYKVETDLNQITG